MTALKNIWQDLVEKKLWPVAVLLVLALVAIPIALGSSGSDAPDTGAAAPGAPAAEAAALPGAGGQTAQVSVTDGELVQRERDGELRDPFKQKAAPKTEDSVAKAPESADDKSPATSSPATSAPASGGTTAPAPAKAPAKKAAPSEPKVVDGHVVRIRFGNDDDLQTFKDLAPLAPLPAGGDPVVVFLGVKPDGKTARFLLSSDALPSGDGRCKPNKAACEAIEAKAGDVVLLDLPTDEGGTRQLQLEVVSIRRNGAATAPSRATTAGTKARASARRATGARGRQVAEGAKAAVAAAARLTR